MQYGEMIIFSEETKEQLRQMDDDQLTAVSVLLAESLRKSQLKCLDALQKNELEQT